MTSGSTNNDFAASHPLLKFGLFNVENLFLLFEQSPPAHFQKMTEPQWQKLSTSVYENKPLQKCLQIADIIIKKSPDIMMFCEVGGMESLENFNKYFLQDLFDVALIEGNSDRNIDVGFLIKKKRNFDFALRSHKERPLNYLYPHESLSQKTGYPIKAQSQFFSRDCAELHLLSRTDRSLELVILLTHLKSRLDPERIDPGGTERRSAELRTCLDIYKEVREIHPKVPVIFAGDMNGFAGRPDTDPEFLPLYAESDFTDALEVAQTPLDKRTTFYQIKSSGRSEGRQIDYCFLSRELTGRLSTHATEVYRYRDEFGFQFDPPKSIEEKLKLPSDHYPIFFAIEGVIKQ